MCRYFAPAAGAVNRRLGFVRGRRSRGAALGADRIQKPRNREGMFMVSRLRSSDRIAPGPSYGLPRAEAQARHLDASRIQSVISAITLSAT
jgi:hypothetical protein